MQCRECAKEHRQLAEWLKDYKRLLEQSSKTWSLDDAREDFIYNVYNILDCLPTNNEANRIIDSFDRVTSGIRQEPCDDAISREAALNSLIDNTHLDGYDLTEALDAIENKEKLPPVTPKQKTGRWVKNDWTPICSCCGKYKYEDIDGSIYDDVWFPNYCPNCGCRMVEPQESEEV
jgi:hypothetical protein